MHKKILPLRKKVNILEVKFNYAYTALIKAGITSLSHYQAKIKSVPGHHVKIIEKLARILKDDDVENIGNSMRSKRNLDFYAGGIEVTEKECREYINFIEKVFVKLKRLLS
jgi:histidyl-tRNA synthetase